MAPITTGLVEAVLDDLTEGPLYDTPDERIAVIPDLIDGATFTHRLTEREIELGVFTATADLAALWRVDELRLASGTELDMFGIDGHFGWHGPEDWLEAFADGDLLAVTVTIDGDGFEVPLIKATVTVEAVAEMPSVTDELIEGVTAAYRAHNTVWDRSVPVHELWWSLLEEHRDAFTDQISAPLDETLEAAGLQRIGGFVAHSDEMWRRELADSRARSIFAQVPDRAYAKILTTAIEVLDDPESSDDQRRDALSDCAQPDGLGVVADVLFDHGIDESDRTDLDTVFSPGWVFELVDRAVAAAERPKQIASAHYLAAVLAERVGDPLTAETHLQRARSALPELQPVIYRLGWYEFDKGNAKGALRLWDHLDVLPPPTHAVLPLLRSASSGPKLGRNESCWCGSGRKFKHCHQRDTTPLPLPERAMGLFRKAEFWVNNAAGSVSQLMATLIVALATGDDDPEALSYAFEDGDELAEQVRRVGFHPIVPDLALHEGGLLELFLHEHGPLLPDDEQILAASWQSVSRSVHEITDVEADGIASLRNLADGEVVNVVPTSSAPRFEVGQVYCARVVPDGAAYQIVGGGFFVRPGQEAAVLDLCDEGDPVALAAWAGALSAPPTLVHRPGSLDAMIDSDALGAVMADFDDIESPEAREALGAELSRQVQAHWLDDHIPALGGLTPREAVADPTRREEVERLLTEFDRDRAPVEGSLPIRYDTEWMRRELGLDD